MDKKVTNLVLKITLSAKGRNINWSIIVSIGNLEVIWVKNELGEKQLLKRKIIITHIKKVTIKATAKKLRTIIINY
jgi:hypothetical protein